MKTASKNNLKRWKVCKNCATGNNFFFKFSNINVCLVNKLMSVSHASVLLLIVNFVITLSK